MSSSQNNPLSSFVEVNRERFEEYDGVTLKYAYALYREYCVNANSGGKLLVPMSMYEFREELKNYFSEFQNRCVVDGVQTRSYYTGFIAERSREVMMQRE